MNKILKYGLIGTGTVAGIAAAGIAYVALTFNPNDYKPQIIKAVKDSKQRNLKLDGDIRLSFFPGIGANVSKVSLSEFKSDKEFAAIESARVSIAFMPLLSKQVVVDEVAVNGLNATLVKHKDGTTNIDDLLGQTGQKQEQKQIQKQEQERKQVAAGSPVKFDIKSVSLGKTSLSYRDEASGAQYAVKDLNLKTGRIAVGVPAKIDLSAGIQANQPKLDINTQIKATLTFDLDRQQYRLEGLDLQAAGSALDISNLQVKAGGEVNADLIKQEFGAKRFSLIATGVKDKNRFEATLDAPSLSFAKDKYSGDKLTLNARLDGVLGNIAASLSLPDMEGNAQSFEVSALTLDLDVRQPEQAFKVKLSSPLSGNVKTRQFNLSNLNVAVNASGDKLPDKSASSEMKGNVQVDAAKEIVQVNLAGGLLQSRVKAKASVKGFAEPAINFDVDVDQFDADMYLPKSPETSAVQKTPAFSVASKTSATPEGSQSRQPEQPLDLSALRTLNLDGSLRIGSLKVANVKSTQVRLDVKAHKGQMNVNPLSARLYQGSVNGSLSVNAQAIPDIAIIQNLNGVNVEALMKDAANLDMLEGKGNIDMNLTTHGNTVSAMKKALNGRFSLNLTDGALKGIDIDRKVLAAQAMLGSGGASSETQSANTEEKTVFREFKATFKVADGVAHNDDLSMRSQQVWVTGAGDINIGNDSIAYLAKAAIAKTSEGKGGITVPLHISGTFTDLKYKLDYGAMISDVVKQKVDTKKEELKQQLQEQLKNKLKGLFK